MPSPAATARTARRWLKDQSEGTPGAPSEIALDIGQLVSPLRLDVLVRASLFETWAQDWDQLRSRPERAIEIAQEHPYRLWFDSVAQAKITGRTESASLDLASADEAFVWRVQRSHGLLDRYMTSGFDQRRPITVKLHPGGALPSGKIMGARLYPVDGCHRLALLWADGIRRLDPTLYRLLPEQTATRDNTSLLLPGLSLSSKDYYTFIGHGYGASHAATEADLFAAVRSDDPRRRELESVLQTDSKLLTQRTTGRAN